MIKKNITPTVHFVYRFGYTPILIFGQNKVRFYGTYVILNFECIKKDTLINFFDQNSLYSPSY